MDLPLILYLKKNKKFALFKIFLEKFEKDKILKIVAIYNIS